MSYLVGGALIAAVGFLALIGRHFARELPGALDGYDSHLDHGEWH